MIKIGIILLSLVLISQCAPSIKVVTIPRAYDLTKFSRFRDLELKLEGVDMGLEWRWEVTLTNKSLELDINEQLNQTYADNALQVKIMNSHFKDLTTINISVIDQATDRPIKDVEQVKVDFDNLTNEIHIETESQQKMFDPYPTNLTVKQNSDSEYVFTYKLQDTYVLSRNWEFQVRQQIDNAYNKPPIQKKLDLASSLEIQALNLGNSPIDLTYRFEAFDGFDIYFKEIELKIDPLSDSASAKLLEESKTVTNKSVEKISNILNSLFESKKVDSTCSPYDSSSKNFSQYGACKDDGQCCNGKKCIVNNRTNKGVCDCGSGFQGLACEIEATQQVLDVAKSISESLNQLLSSNTTTITPQLAESSIFSLQSVSTISDPTILQNTLNSLDKVAISLRSPEAFKSLLQITGKADSNIGGSTTINAEQKMQKQEQLQNTIRSGLLGLAKGSTASVTVEVGNMRAQVSGVDTAAKKSVIQSEAFTADFDLSSLGANLANYKTIALNKPKSLYDSINFSNQLDGDIIELSTIDVGVNPQDTPKFANVSSSGTASALKIQFKTLITQNDKKGNACAYYNTETKKYEFTLPKSPTPGQPMQCEFSHNSDFATATYDKIVRTYVNAYKITLSIFLTLSTLLITLI